MITRKDIPPCGHLNEEGELVQHHSFDCIDGCFRLI